MPPARRAFQCNICNRSFLSQGGLTQHHRRKHSRGRYQRPQNVRFVASFDESGDKNYGDRYEVEEEIEEEEQTQLVMFSGAGTRLDIPRVIPAYDNPEWKPLTPFENQEQWAFCRTYLEENIGKNTLDKMICRNTINPCARIRSADHFRELIHEMEDGLGCEWEKETIDIEGSYVDYWYRNPIAIIRYIFSHPQFLQHLKYAPIKDYNSSGERIYSEMWTSNWWWRQQVYLKLRL